LEQLVVNGGRMRLIVGWTLGDAELTAIQQGVELRSHLEKQLATFDYTPTSDSQLSALELLTWMIAKGHLDIRFAIPCDEDRHPIPGPIFHEKSGIIEDKTGDMIAFSGSNNETPSGWLDNWEGFHVFRSWTDEAAHVDAQESSFGALWYDRDESARVYDLRQALEDGLREYLPAEGELPRRLKGMVSTPAKPAEPEPPPQDDRFATTWAFIHGAAAQSPSGDFVGAATSAVDLWPHQTRAYLRMYKKWPPRLLIADEVGLGKTIQAGIILRQGILAGRIRRAIVLAPASVVRQWQFELREKFNLNWPIYDGSSLSWYDSTFYRDGQERRPFRAVTRTEWHREPFVIVSHNLMRREERRPELLVQAERFDLIIVDEAHHARRKGGATAKKYEPNRMLRLLSGLSSKTNGLVLLTATPLQVGPVEVWDLLKTIGIPQSWSETKFLEYFEILAEDNPDTEKMRLVAKMFVDLETMFGTSDEEALAKRYADDDVFLVRNVLDAIHSTSIIPLRELSNAERRLFKKILRGESLVKRLVSRNTRELLRKYYAAGMISTQIPHRIVQDDFVNLSPEEREVYEAVENYISTTYNNASQEAKTAIGFVMTIYRKRLSSSFAALRRTLEKRLNRLQDQESIQSSAVFPLLDEDYDEEDSSIPSADDEVAIDALEHGKLETEALRLEEAGSLHELLAMAMRLPLDTKAQRLQTSLKDLASKGYSQVIIFTQFTDTLDFLREYLAEVCGHKVICFTGRGGEYRKANGSWTIVSREDIKRRFKAGEAEILLCTDAAAEGLNFQFCGALVNYDMPWNPMRVEQRIGRIDRLGQRYKEIAVRNLHYAETVETDVYLALRSRIHLFESFVGRLQPILSKLPKLIADVTLSEGGNREQRRSELQDTIYKDILDQEKASFDIDDAGDEVFEIQKPTPPAYDLKYLRSILEDATLLPPGHENRGRLDKDYAYSAPGLKKPIRVTTDPDYFAEHSDSVELWSPGAPVFPR
jgi:superfamily II DNA or RNA helicase